MLYGRWETTVAGVVARRIERETGRVELTFFSPTEEAMLEAWYREGVRPKAAADALLDMRADAAARPA